MDIDSITIDSPGWFQNSIVARKWQYSDAVNALAKHVPIPDEWSDDTKELKRFQVSTAS